MKPTASPPANTLANLRGPHDLQHPQAENLRHQQGTGVAALQSQMKGAADALRAKGYLTDVSGEINPLNPEIMQAVINLYKDAAILGKRNYMLVKRFGAPTSFINRVLDYLKLHILNKVVVPISNTTQRIISNIIQQAIRKGWGVEKTAKYMESAPITKQRARLIIRTESVRATNLSQWLAADDEVYQIEKRWIAIEDNRTRPTHSHAGVDGQVHNLQDRFSNGLMYPGDPDGPASETCNCRCTLSYKVKRDANGRPVKKEILPAVFA